MGTPRMVLVDGSAMLFRAYYAIPSNLRTSSGIVTNAVFGFATMFKKLFAGKTPEFGAVVFDAPGPTFRDAEFADYKANREAPPDDLNAQRPWVDKLVKAHQFPLLRVRGYEADDVIGTLTKKAEARGYEVLIVSGDKDFVQLIGPQVRMLDAMRDITYDVELSKKKWGVPPHQFVDLLALIGDKIDNIPGVVGIGKKGAAELLETYGDLETLLSRKEELKGKKRILLEEHEAMARLSKRLATIDVEVPLPVALDDLELPPLEPSRLNALYRELEFNSLLTEEAKAAAETEQNSVGVEVAESSEALERWLAENEASPIALFPAYDEPAVSASACSGVSLYCPKGQSIYFDLRDCFCDALVRFLEDADQPKLFHDAKRFMILCAPHLHQEGISGIMLDTKLASFLIDPNKLLPHRLDQIAKEYLQRPLPPVKRIVGSGKSEKRLFDLSPQEIAPWAALQAQAIWDAHRPILSALEREGQAEQLRQTDLPLSFLLSRMERTGILVDVVALQTAEEEFEGRLSELELEIHNMAGRSFNVGSTKQLSTVLFEELKLPVIKRTKTGYSTNAEVLERLAPKHPIAALLLEHRKLAKLINTYTRVLTAAVHPQTGRVHANFQQTVGVTGRLISTDPDLQRTPIKTPEGERIRTAFVAPEGCKLVSADWSQIELRILAHVSSDPKLMEAFASGQDVHARTAAELFQVPLAEVDKDKRRIGKTVNFATVYGQGATALAQILSIPRKEAQSYIDGYFATYAGVRSWLDQTIEQAKERGFVETLFGRRRYIPELSSNAFMERAAGERIAANTPIQGSAADICKAAMLNIDEALKDAQLESQMVLQIHDELLFECPDAEVEQVKALVQHHMSSVYALKVPLITDVGHGKSWAEAH